MATPSFASHDLLARLENAGADGDVDKIREILKAALQHLIEVQAAIAIGADRYERTDERTSHRNGARVRTLDTGAGRLPLTRRQYAAATNSCIARQCKLAGAMRHAR